MTIFRLHAGYKNIEKSPVDDIKLLFERSVIDRKAASILAVCLCYDATGSNDENDSANQDQSCEEDSRVCLRALVEDLCRSYGFDASQPYRRLALPSSHMSHRLRTEN
jgi:hypothetical protein